MGSLRRVIQQSRRLLREPEARRFLREILQSPSQRKHVFRWLESLEPGYGLNNGVPWLTFDAVGYLKRVLLPGLFVFEYGSGGSTIFWLKWRARLVSVEHNPVWYELVRSKLVDSDNLTYLLVPPRPAATLYREGGLDVSDPEQYLSDDPDYWGCSFENYIRQIDFFPEEYFDVVLVDGRARPSAIVHSISRVKVGGMLILDDAERPYYLKNTQRLLQDNFYLKEFCGVRYGTFTMSRTNIYVRKKRG